MSMVVFMPWCRIDRAYKVGDIEILPFERHKPIDGLDSVAQSHVYTIMATYKTITGEPVDTAALVRYGNRSLVDDLNKEEVDIVYDLVALACFCGLARRSYFDFGPYCNSDCFALYIQKFQQADFTTLNIRRREGRTWSGWRIDDIAVTIPVHCHTVRQVTLDEVLIEALIGHRSRSNNDEWGRWQNAISCFNQANTDSDTIRHQVEWVLLCSAFEHLLGAKPKAEDVARKFSEVMVPKEPVMASNATRRSDRWTDQGNPLRYEWMREFYRIRGDFAHGKLNTQQPAVWEPLEHLFLAAIAFPNVVKCLLEDARIYTLTDNDRAQIDSFEKFADTNKFLEPPDDQANSFASHWKRLVNHSKLDLAFERIWKECEAKGLIAPDSDDTPDTHDSVGQEK